MQNSIYQLNCHHYSSCTALNKLLKSALPLRLAENRKQHRRFLDTFDWRLFNAGCLLEEETGNYERILRLRSLPPVSTVTEEIVGGTPEFYWDIAHGKLREMLKKLIKERALMDMGSLEARSTLYEVRDELDKIILRLKVTGMYSPVSSAGGRPVSAWLEIHPLRGYRAESEKTATLLIDQHLFGHLSKDTALKLFKALGKTPANYSSKMNVKLEKHMPGHFALSTVLLYNLDIMERNEPGIRKDIDIEFLHDFRVANRRSRSLVTQVKRVFPETELERYRKSFAWLSKLTSTHRDLDVFLADFAVYEKKIPRNGGGELVPLRELLQRNRKKERRRLLRALDSRRFADFKHNWRSFLEKEPPARLAERGSMPIIDVASRSIWRNYKKLLKQGEALKTSYTYESIHKLRKDGKKLRYLLEAFRSLYPKDDMSSVIGILKKLQNNLGDIVDMHTQRFMLEDWKRELQENKRAPEDTIKAIDYLVSLCNAEEKRAEKKFNKRYCRFSSKANQKLFVDLFK